VNRIDAFLRSIDQLGARSRALKPEARANELRRLFLEDAGRPFAELASDLYSDFLEGLRERGIEDPFKAGTYLSGFLSLTDMEYDERAGFSGSDWKRVAQSVSDNADNLDIEFLNYASGVALEHGGFKEE
jgi:hypothetical protein